MRMRFAPVPTANGRKNMEFYADSPGNMTSLGRTRFKSGIDRTDQPRLGPDAVSIISPAIIELPRGKSEPAGLWSECKHRSRCRSYLSTEPRVARRWPGVELRPGLSTPEPSVAGRLARAPVAGTRSRRAAPTKRDGSGPCTSKDLPQRSVASGAGSERRGSHGRL